jgi:hypothetical protein
VQPQTHKTSALSGMGIPDGCSDRQEADRGAARMPMAIAARAPLHAAPPIRSTRHPHLQRLRAGPIVRSPHPVALRHSPPPRISNRPSRRNAEGGGTYEGRTVFIKQSFDPPGALLTHACHFLGAQQYVHATSAASPGNTPSWRCLPPSAIAGKTRRRRSFNPPPPPPEQT